MNAYQKRLIEEQKAKAEREGITEEVLRERQLEKARFLRDNPGTEKFASIAISIQLAAFHGRLDSVLWFLDSKRTHADEVDAKGLRAIHYAAERGHINIVDTLLKRGSKADALGRGEITPSMMAAKGGNPNILRMLFINGANLLAQDVSGMTAAHYAAQEDNDSCIGMLDVLSIDHFNNLLNTETLKTEEENMIQSNEIGKLSKMNSVVSMPTVSASASVVSYTTSANASASMHEASADMQHLISFVPKSVLQTPAKNGAHPLHVACAFDSRRVIQLLLQIGVAIDPKDAMHETPLHKAARKNFNLSYRMLKEFGANETVKNLMRESPRDVLLDKYS